MGCSRSFELRMLCNSRLETGTSEVPFENSIVGPPTILLARRRTYSVHVEKGSDKMASIRMILEEEALGKTRDVYEEIKTELGIDFVPNLYKVMASKPGYLEANWNRVKAVMVEPGKLDRLTKEIIAVAVSAVNACDY